MISDKHDSERSQYEPSSLTCASFPPATCHTLRDMSRDPVITWSESIVNTKHVTSSLCDTVYLSSSRFNDQIRKLQQNCIR